MGNELARDTNNNLCQSIESSVKNYSVEEEKLNHGGTLSPISREMFNASQSISRGQNKSS